jgi:hypothetical protein
MISRVSPPFSEERALDIRGKFFNAFSHPQYCDPATAFGTASFAYLESTSVAPGIFQLNFSSDLTRRPGSTR